VSAVEPSELPDDLLLCYCTMLTVGELRRACAAGCWPLPGKDRTGKLCTGCVGDLLHCLRQFGAESRSPGGADA
jgi:NAD(P)H-nitrite reductase large subunit